MAKNNWGQNSKDLFMVLENELVWNWFDENFRPLVASSIRIMISKNTTLNLTFRMWRKEGTQVHL